ncbi:aminotransferase class I/II-fold pyridoxal phosphate-dependent enzyme [Croceivirga thetidis]|uniref:Pyridoxal phosphate-dependent aminotransferase family protein n=1 Tax=Croceivirga thetidis TaxID=2721623 RepID=A0ABX1GR17_9FLAO|nr:pyridoxal phosphate-dependent aminotransferase family protein [Croceivirga thetidis]NKI31491.1 pyridoxal phosphate-dependent aminotransferase family protein [Croceivirga thetidis]
MGKFPAKLDNKLQKRVRENALRSLTTSDKLVDFSSNDYLGFARDTVLKKRVEGNLLDVKFNGATGSRLLSGNHEYYGKLEAVLCTYHQAEAALVFNSGYDANLGFFSSVPQRNDTILYDELCHASIRDGIKLSNANSIKFKHNDLTDLQKVIERIPEKTAGDMYLVTESVFSMDGDSPDLIALANFCSEKQIYLIVDEAHAVGVFKNGLVNQLNLEDAVFARIVTFGKALGSHGAAVLCGIELRTYLINFCRSLIYTTALPPHSILSSFYSYRYLQEEEGLAAIKKLLDNISYFKSTVERLKLNTYFSESESAIQVFCKTGNNCIKKLSNSLAEIGFDIKPILSPTVPKGQERLRICMHSFNTKNEIDKVLATINENL